MKLKIMHLYPDLLNLYGDTGNIEALKKRLVWRGIDAEVVQHTLNDTDMDLSDIDILFLGGGTDREEKIAVSKLIENRRAISDYVNSDKTLVAVCGGFWMLGKYYEYDGVRTEGLGILDIYAEEGQNRFTGDIVLDSLVTDGAIVGFENHGSRMYTGDYEPLGKVKHGNGNNDNDSAEGLVYKNVIATHLHGPLLPKNPKLCDYILTNALKRKYPEFEGLSPLLDDIENNANDFIVKRYEK